MLCTYTRAMTDWRLRQALRDYMVSAMLDDRCVCGHDRDAHAAGGDYCRVPDCVCEGWMAND